MGYKRKSLIDVNISDGNEEVKSADFITFANIVGEHKELKYSLKDINDKLCEAHYKGEKLTITYFTGKGFEDVTGIVQEVNHDERTVKILYYKKVWNIRIYDIVEIKDWSNSDGK